MRWLLDVLAEARDLRLDDDRERAFLAAAIIEAIPKHVVVEAIAGSADAVLGVRGIADSGAALEIGRNAAQCVLVLLMVDPDPDNELAVPEAIAP